MATAALLLGGCQTSSSLQDGPFGMQVEDPMRNAPPITQGLDAEGLSTLLGAELAGQRGDYRYASQGVPRSSAALSRASTGRTRYFRRSLWQ
ncbi:hypothetical protein HSBAA_45660 [Vreelandella sulfidaeris]|uniref:Uncharacterized protein n=1 Tax=Vreelandella sulfidaeris TaxID=115553 RepID=A0A455UAM4_9GAMM|nr:hypothetical protein HSBAA_45660 [Halomonas sulfidaeris]